MGVTHHGNYCAADSDANSDPHTDRNDNPDADAHPHGNADADPYDERHADADAHPHGNADSNDDARTGHSVDHGTFAPQHEKSWASAHGDDRHMGSGFGLSKLWADV
jgi:hypothetical protein